jgi:hypothetical protein
MLDFESVLFKRSLAETVEWCAMQSLVANPADSDAARNRRALYEQSERQMQEARGSANQGSLRRKITDTKQWHQATALLKQLRDSLGPMKVRLRSDTLKPSFRLNEFGTLAPWAEAAAEVVSKRSQLLGKISPEEGLKLSTSGRLLIYYPHENLACGAAEVSSNGFFDVNNVPPWDIWVDFSERTLVSWVPPVFLEAAQMGIDVNPEACIRWAT